MFDGGFMLGAVTIVNRLPTSVIFEGKNYKLTADLSLKEVLLFIERDLFQLRKRFSELRPKFALSLLKVNSGIPQIRIGVVFHDSGDVKALQREVEDILWSYNHQELIGCHGNLVPALPRFRYHIDFSTETVRPTWLVVKGESDHANR